jgi:hypothetical protein
MFKWRQQNKFNMTKNDFYRGKVNNDGSLMLEDIGVKRTRSRELDFGVWWRDHNRQYPHYRVTWVENTGEVIAVKLNNFDEDSESYKILGVVKTEEEIEAKLKGWADVCGDDFSLDWIKKNIA